MELWVVCPSVDKSGGGVTEVVKINARLLAAAGRNVTILTFIERGALSADAGDIDGVCVRGFPFYGPSNFRFSPAMLWYMLRHGRGSTVYVHGAWMFHCACVFIWSLVFRGRYYVAPHGMLEPWILARSKFLKRAVGLLFHNRFLKGCARFQALTLQEQANIRAVCPGASVSVIGNIPASVASSPKVRGFKETDLTFLYIGRIHEKKGWRELCEAWSIVCRSLPGKKQDLNLVFAGWIDGAVDFLSTIERLNRDYGNVRFVGAKFGEAKYTCYDEADVVVLPSKSEGMPMVILEAWSRGVPTIMTASCNLPSGFEQGAAIECGHSAAEIAAALVAFAKLKEAKRESMRQNCFRVVQQEFSEAKLQENLLSFLRMDESQSVQ